jgi:hypothetical protein
MHPSLNYAVFTHALHALQDGDLPYAEALGFTCDELYQLSTLSPCMLMFFSRSPVPLITLTVHHEPLHRRLLHVHQETLRQQQIDRAIRLGGSIELLSTCFGLTSADVCQRRRLTGVSVPQGRSPLPDDTTDARIWHLWQQHHPGTLTTPDALDVMMSITEALSADTPISLTAVRNRIVLCEREKADRKVAYAG